jgi:NCS1 family nucleobase:cation symporter-1
MEPIAGFCPLGEPRSTVLLCLVLVICCYWNQHIRKLSLVLERFIIMVSKWINARRGSYISCIISIAVTPWNIQYSAASFSAFLGGYSMFLGPIAGIMMADFWVLRGKHLNLFSLYRHPDIYSFFHGFNLRALVAFILAIVPNLARLAKATGQKDIPKGATYVYNLSWLVETTVAFVVYLVLGKIWLMEEKWYESGVIDSVDGSSMSRGSDEEVKVAVDEKSKDF